MTCEQAKTASSSEDAVVVRVRYFAGAKAATGISDEQITVTAKSTVADVLHLARQRHGDRLATVLSASSVLLNGTAVRDRTMPIGVGTELDVLPPFAGG